MIKRRDLLVSVLLAGLVLPAAPAFAGGDDGSDSGGEHDSGGDGGGDDGGSGGDDGGGDGGDGGGDGGDKHGGDDDGDDDKGFGGAAGTARDAVRSGNAAPLSDVLRLIRNKYPGQVLHVDVDTSPNGLLYVIRVLDPQNRRIEVTVNATTRQIVSASLY